MQSWLGDTCDRGLTSSQLRVILDAYIHPPSTPKPTSQPVCSLGTALACNQSVPPHHNEYRNASKASPRARSRPRDPRHGRTHGEGLGCLDTHYVPLARVPGPGESLCAVRARGGCQVGRWQAPGPRRAAWRWRTLAMIAGGNLPSVSRAVTACRVTGHPPATRMSYQGSAAIPRTCQNPRQVPRHGCHTLDQPNAANPA